jgi:IS5 family transposase
VKADRTTKLSEDDAVTEARVHDRQVVEALGETDDGSVPADSAYTGDAIETILAEHGGTGEMCAKGSRNHPLTKAQKKRHRKKSTIRVRVEPMFGFMTNTMQAGLHMRGIGMPRIPAGIGLVNLVYTLARYEQILRLRLA